MQQNWQKSISVFDLQQTISDFVQGVDLTDAINGPYDIYLSPDEVNNFMASVMASSWFYTLENP